MPSKLTNDQFLERLYSIRQNTHPQEDYKGAGVKILVDFDECECDPQKVRAFDLLRLCKCPSCYSNMDIKNFKFLKLLFSIRDDAEVLEKYKGYKTNILVNFKKCLCDPQMVSPQHLLIKYKGKFRGCPGCRDERSSKTRSISHKEFLDWIFKYRYMELLLLERYKNAFSYIKVLWVECLHITELKAYSIKNGNGCYKCAISKLYSKISQKWLNEKEQELGRKLIREYKFNKDTKHMSDGYDPVTNTIYEFYGDYWHGNPNNPKTDRGSFTKKIYQKTLIREELIKNLGYNLVTIWESEWIKH